MIRERPILFSGAMVRAILAGTKTQTRRLCKAAKDDDGEDYRDSDGWPLRDMSIDGAGDVRIISPYGRPGERLWVRETHAIVPRTAYRCSDGVQQTLRPDDDHDAAIYREGWTRSRGGFRWRPSIHMPRWASRITLEIADVRVERLQQISRGDAMAEGCPFANMAAGPDPRAWYSDLWRCINGKVSWDENPWVWVLTFRRQHPDKPGEGSA